MKKKPTIYYIRGIIADTLIGWALRIYHKDDPAVEIIYKAFKKTIKNPKQQ